MISAVYSPNYDGKVGVQVSDLSDDLLYLKQWKFETDRRSLLHLRSYMEFSKETRRHKFKLVQGWGFMDPRGMPRIKGLPEMPTEVCDAARESIIAHFRDVAIYVTDDDKVSYETHTN